MSELPAPQNYTPEQIDAGKDLLATLKAVVTRKLADFIEVGEALDKIRRLHLYKLDGYKTFEAFVNATWDRQRRWAYRLISAYKVTENVSDRTQNKPTSEWQTRPLQSLPPGDQAAAWQYAVDLAEGKQPTATQVRAAADEFRQRDTPQPKYDTVSFLPDQNPPKQPPIEGPPEPNSRYGGKPDRPDNTAVPSVRSAMASDDPERRSPPAMASAEPSFGAVKAKAPEVEDVEPISETKERKPPRPKANPHQELIDELEFLKSILCLLHFRDVTSDQDNTTSGKDTGSTTCTTCAPEGLAIPKTIPYIKVYNIPIKGAEFFSRIEAALSKYLRGLQTSDDCRLNPPTEDEVRQEAAKIGLTDGDALAYFDARERSGWLYGSKQQQPVRSWTADLRSYTRRMATFDARDEQERAIRLAKDDPFGLIAQRLNGE